MDQLSALLILINQRYHKQNNGNFITIGEFRSLLEEVIEVEREYRERINSI